MVSNSINTFESQDTKQSADLFLFLILVIKNPRVSFEHGIKLDGKLTRPFIIFSLKSKIYSMFVKLDA